MILKRKLEKTIKRWKVGWRNNVIMTRWPSYHRVLLDVSYTGTRINTLIHLEQLLWIWSVIGTPEQDPVENRNRSLKPTAWNGYGLPLRKGENGIEMYIASHYIIEIVETWNENASDFTNWIQDTTVYVHHGWNMSFTIRLIFWRQ